MKIFNYEIKIQKAVVRHEDIVKYAEKVKHQFNDEDRRIELIKHLREYFCNKKFDDTVQYSRNFDGNTTIGLKYAKEIVDQVTNFKYEVD